MIYYLGATIFPLLMWGLYEQWSKSNLTQKNKETVKKATVFLAILPIFLLFVLRYKTVGVDTIGYVRFFETEVRQYTFQELFNSELMRTEIGYRVYVKLISTLTDNYTVYFFINGLIIFGTLWRFSFKYTKNPFVFFFLFIALGTYQFVETGLRQTLAMMICLWAVDLIKNKKPIWFVLAVILAYYFHKSAVIFLIMYPLSMVKKYDWMIAMYVVMAAVFLVGFAAFQEFFNQLLGYEYEIEETGNGGIFMLFVMILFVYSLFMMYDKPNEVDGQSLIVQLSLMTIVFWLLRLVSRTAERISYYYIFGLYIYVSQAVQYDRDKATNILKWLLILAALVLFVYRNMAVSYMFFWQGV